MPAACYCCVAFPYGGGIVAGPAVALAGPVLGAWLAFHLGAASGLYRAGYRWLILLSPALAAAVLVPPLGFWLDRQSKEEEHRRLITALDDEDPAPFLARLRIRRSRDVVEEHLEQFLVCAGAHSKPEVVDALAALDPRGKEGYALCAAARYPRVATVRHLLDEGFSATHGRTPSGQPCEPLLELVDATSTSPPCSGESEEFAATPTAESCRQRTAVATLLIEAGASPPGHSPFRLDACDDGGAPGSPR